MFDSPKPYGDLSKIFESIDRLVHPYKYILNQNNDYFDYIWEWFDFRYNYDYLERWR